MPLDQQSKSIIREQVTLWAVEGQVDKIISMIEVFKDQRDQAEFQRDAYLHEIRELSKRTKAILDPLLNKPSSEAKPKTSKPKSALDIDITF